MSEKSNPLILCIDDDATALTLLKYLLEHGDCRALTATDGLQGLELARDHQPAVILLDIEMPGLNGYEVCLKLQKDPKTAYIPVVFLTALSSRQDRQKAFAAGAADFLGKPFHLNPLMEKIHLQLERNGKWQQLKKPQRENSAQPSRFFEFKEYAVRKFEFSPDKKSRWLQVSPLNLYQSAHDFGIEHEQMAKLLARFLEVPYIEHIRSQIIRIGLIPTLFSKTNHILAVDPSESGIHFILSNPFDWGLLDTMKKFMGANEATRFGVTRPETIDELFAGAAKNKTAPAGIAQALESVGLYTPVAEPAAARALHADIDKHRSILVVDDDITSQMLVKHYLLAEGYRVSVADDGIDALHLLRREKFDLIVSDINMPHLDGLKLLEIMHQKAMQTPVLLVSGSSGSEDEIKGLELGAADYIRKPLNRDTLLFRVKKACGGLQRHLGAA